MGTRVLLLCGGKSEEHEVSLASARSVMAAADQHLEVTTLVIDKQGLLLNPDTSRHILSTGQHHDLKGQGQTLDHLKQDIDLVFPLLHGPLGEDGSIQGMLKLMGLPFVGSDVLGSAVGMDKAMMKAVFAAHGLPQVAYLSIKRHDWHSQPEAILKDIQSQLAFPIFVKPANLGSSVGISKAVDSDTLKRAMTEAARHDRRIIVEQGLSQARELEVAILGNDQPQASPVGEISFQSDFYDYATKYTEGCAQLSIPAAIPAALSQQIQGLAIQAFEAVDAAGLARVDFFYTPNGQLYLNEINTMPGFTTTSMYPKLWEAAGIGYPELVQRLITLGLERHQSC